LRTVAAVLLTPFLAATDGVPALQTLPGAHSGWQTLPVQQLCVMQTEPVAQSESRVQFEKDGQTTGWTHRCSPPAVKAQRHPFPQAC
jgi:hypothetical protein